MGCIRPFFSVGYVHFADVAQLARATPCHGVGCGFESRHPLQTTRSVVCRTKHVVRSLAFAYTPRFASSGRPPEAKAGSFTRSKYANLNVLLVRLRNIYDSGMSDIFVQNIEKMSDSRTFIDESRRAIVQLPSVIIGRGIYKPGWRWSEHAGPQTGKSSARHIGLIESGKMIIRTIDGTQTAIGPGDAFEVGAGHDAWVIGDEPCVALDFETRKS